MGRTKEMAFSVDAIESKFRSGEGQVDGEWGAWSENGAQLANNTGADKI